MKLIKENRVVLVLGETGSGKTTQVRNAERQNRRYLMGCCLLICDWWIDGDDDSDPLGCQIPQFLLDDCCHSREPCRIFCTQPRRLAAIAVAERVAAERGETVGGTVGYHIRLESRYGRMDVVPALPGL